MDDMNPTPMQQEPDSFLPTRRSLLSRLRHWDNHASWGEFNALYGRFLLSVALRSGLRRPDAEDVVQEILVSVAKELPNFQYNSGKGSFKGWLTQIAKRRVVDHLRKAQRARPLPHSGEDTQGSSGPSFQPADNDMFENIWEEEWRSHHLQMALEKVKQKVSPRDFQIFDCLALQKASLPQAARTFGLNRAHLYVIRHRIAKMLKAELEAME